MGEIYNNENSNVTPNRPNIGRIPVVPIPYNTDRVMKNEIMVDWANRTIYGKNKEGEIVPLDGSTPRLENDHKLGVGFFGLNRPFPARWIFDDASLVFRGKVGQIRNFHLASPGAVPFKTNDNVLDWTNGFNYFGSSMKRFAIRKDKGLNNFVTLRAGDICYSDFSEDNSEKIILLLADETDTNDYFKIYWNLKTGSDVSTLSFAKEIIWRYDDNYPVAPNTNRIYIFETWNRGITWYGDWKGVSGEASWNTDKPNYFTKNEINTISGWKYLNEEVVHDKYVICVRTYAEYEALSEKNNDTFYFIEDSCQIYRGEYPFSNSFTFIESFETINNPIPRTLYIDKNLKSAVWDGSKWVEVCRPITDTIDENTNIESLVSYKALKFYINNMLASTIPTIANDSNKNNLVTVKALIDYIDSTKYVKNITFENGILKYRVNSESTDTEVPFNGYITDIDIDIETNTLQYRRIGSENPITIELSPHVIGGVFDKANGEIALFMSNATEIRIDAAELVSSISGAVGVSSSDSVKVVTRDDVNYVEIRLSNDSDNGLSIKTDELGRGLFMAKAIPAFKTTLTGRKIALTNSETGGFDETDYFIDSDGENLSNLNSIPTGPVISDLLDKIRTPAVINGVRNLITWNDDPSNGGFSVPITIGEDLITQYQFVQQYNLDVLKEEDGLDTGKISVFVETANDIDKLYKTNFSIINHDDNSNRDIHDIDNTVIPTIDYIRKDLSHELLNYQKYICNIEDIGNDVDITSSVSPAIILLNIIDIIVLNDSLGYLKENIKNFISESLEETESLKDTINILKESSLNESIIVSTNGDRMFIDGTHKIVPLDINGNEILVNNITNSNVYGIKCIFTFDSKDADIGPNISYFYIDNNNLLLENTDIRTSIEFESGTDDSSPDYTNKIIISCTIYL